MWLYHVSEMMFSLGLFINAALFIPQVIKLYQTKKADEFSLVTFLGFCFIQIFTVIHGYLHKDYILLAGYLLSLLTCGALTGLIIKYRLDKAF
jgi:MtN3 and saliva related transmembrane protein